MAITKLRKCRNLYHELGILEERIMFGYPTERGRRRNACPPRCVQEVSQKTTRNAKRNARRKKVFAAFEVELDELPF